MTDARDRRFRLWATLAAVCVLPALGILSSCSDPAARKRVEVLERRFAQEQLARQRSDRRVVEALGATIERIDQLVLTLDGQATPPDSVDATDSADPTNAAGSTGPEGPTDTDNTGSANPDSGTGFPGDSSETAPNNVDPNNAELRDESAGPNNLAGGTDSGAAVADRWPITLKRSLGETLTPWILLAAALLTGFFLWRLWLSRPAALATRGGLARALAARDVEEQLPGPDLSIQLGADRGNHTSSVSELAREVVETTPAAPAVEDSAPMKWGGAQHEEAVGQSMAEIESLLSLAESGPSSTVEAVAASADEVARATDANLANLTVSDSAIAAPTQPAHEPFLPPDIASVGAPGAADFDLGELGAADLSAANAELGNASNLFDQGIANEQQVVDLHAPAARLEHASVGNEEAAELSADSAERAAVVAAAEAASSETEPPEPSTDSALAAAERTPLGDNEEPVVIVWSDLLDAEPDTITPAPTTSSPATSIDDSLAVAPSATPPALQGGASLAPGSREPAPAPHAPAAQVGGPVDDPLTASQHASAPSARALHSFDVPRLVEDRMDEQPVAPSFESSSISGSGANRAIDPGFVNGSSAGPHGHAPHVTAGPAVWTVVLPQEAAQAATVEQSVFQLLTDDPRVLQEPSPRLALDDEGRTCMVFALLPGLEGGDRLDLRQALERAGAEIPQR